MSDGRFATPIDMDLFPFRQLGDAESTSTVAAPPDGGGAAGLGSAVHRIVVVVALLLMLSGGSFPFPSHSTFVILDRFAKIRCLIAFSKSKSHQCFSSTDTLNFDSKVP